MFTYPTKIKIITQLKIFFSRFAKHDYEILLAYYININLVITFRSATGQKLYSIMLMINVVVN